MAEGFCDGDITKLKDSQKRFLDDFNRRATRSVRERAGNLCHAADSSDSSWAFRGEGPEKGQSVVHATAARWRPSAAVADADHGMVVVDVL